MGSTYANVTVIGSGLDAVKEALAGTGAHLAEIGRDVEQLVLSRAVRLWAQDRVFLNRERTVVFSS